MTALDAWIAACLPPLAVWLLMSGIDDLFIDLAWLAFTFRDCFFSRDAGRLPTEEELAAVPEKRIAVFVPLWREHRVIRKMLEHNLSSIRYANYDFFVGCYPNDELTAAAVREMEENSTRVHLSLCPHNGPTCKADNLNWIYQSMLFYEERHGVRFELVVTHDAEDLMHPDSLRWINYYADQFDMVQIPVLPLATPFSWFTHGVYCDEFAEFQLKDMTVRKRLGGFVPSNGVGTGYTRRALEKLAGDGGVFDPTTQTEDYVNGLRLHRLRCPQIFVPVRFFRGAPVATREYFPDTFRKALRQRTRWVAGIALQSWQRYGWSGGAAQAYWFWRDRKGLIGNPLTLLVNAVFLYGAATWIWSRLAGLDWKLGQAAAYPLLVVTFGLQLIRTGVRTGCTARIYGWTFALLAPLRIAWGNWINCAATVSALARFFAAQLRAQPLDWLKTEHIYPARGALATDRRRLGQILIEYGDLTHVELEAALRNKPAEFRLGEYLVRLGRLSEQRLYAALSLQHHLPFLMLKPADVPRAVARTLPASVVSRWQVLPYRIAAGSMFLAGPEPPSEKLYRELRIHTQLEVHYHLITRGNFDQLVAEFIARPGHRRRDNLARYN